MWPSTFYEGTEFRYPIESTQNKKKPFQLFSFSLLVFSINPHFRAVTSVLWSSWKNLSHVLLLLVSSIHKHQIFLFSSHVFRWHGWISNKFLKCYCDEYLSAIFIRCFSAEIWCFSFWFLFFSFFCFFFNLMGA